MPVAYEITDANNPDEHRLAVGCASSTEFLQQIESAISREDLKYLEGDYCKLAVTWCLEYYDQYQTAPGDHLFDIVRADVAGKVSRMTPEAQANLLEYIKRLAADLQRNKGIPSQNIPYVIKQSVKYLGVRSITAKMKEVQAKLDLGQLEEAQTQLASSASVSMGQASFSDPFDPADQSLRQAFKRVNEGSLYKFGGKLGEITNPQLYRQGFIAYLAGIKGGKTWMLVEHAYRALSAGLSVALFEVGDLTKAEVAERVAVRVSGRNIDPEFCKRQCVTVRDCLHSRNGTCPVRKRTGPHPTVGEYLDMTSGAEQLEKFPVDVYQPCTKCPDQKNWKYIPYYWFAWQEAEAPMTYEESLVTLMRFQDRTKGIFRCKAFFDQEGLEGNSEATMKNVANHLKIWQRRDGFTADVVIVDYLDQLRARDTRVDKRFQCGEIWDDFRKLTMSMNCLGITAVQSNRDGLDVDVKTAKNTSDDNSKNARCTALFSLNQTEEECQQGIMRVALPIVRRGVRTTGLGIGIITQLQHGKIAEGCFYPKYRLSKKYGRGERNVKAERKVSPF